MTKRALLLLLAAAACACRSVPARDCRPAPKTGEAEPEKSFETRWLPAPASLEGLSAKREQVNRFDLGRFLVIETNDVYLPPGRASFLIDSETILTKDASTKQLLEQFLLAAYPNAAGGPTLFVGDAGVGAPDVQTVEEYVSGLEKGAAEDREKWAREKPGQPYPFPAQDYAKMRADFAADLAGRDGVVLRYVNAKRP